MDDGIIKVMRIAGEKENKICTKVLQWNLPEDLCVLILEE